MKLLSAKERMQRESEVKAMIAEGATLTDIAKRYNITQQAAFKFLKVRDWKTKQAEERSGALTPEAAEKERIKAERRERRKLMKEKVDRS